MGRQQIFEKLAEKLKSSILTEADVVYILSRTRKILEIDNKKKERGILNFYCNLALHSRIDDVPTSIIKSLIRISDGPNPSSSNEDIYNNSIVGLEDFHKEFKDFLSKNDLPESLYDQSKRVARFNKLLFEIFADTPIILNKKHRVSIDLNGGISFSPYNQSTKKRDGD